LVIVQFLSKIHGPYNIKYVCFNLYNTVEDNGLFLTESINSFPITEAKEFVLSRLLVLRLYEANEDTFQVNRVVLNIKVCWYMISCILVRCYRLMLTTLKIEAAGSFETSITIYKVTQHHVQTCAKCKVTEWSNKHRAFGKSLCTFKTRSSIEITIVS
jgi:hypothetical protein